MQQKRSGILLHISSLPGNTGIGTLGKASYDFVNWLSLSRQTLWQILPLGPTGYGDSPYSSFSAFAGNPYFVDFDLLVQKGWAEPSCYSYPFSKNDSSKNERVDYQSYRLKENEIGKNKVKIALREYAGKGKYIEELLK